MELGTRIFPYLSTPITTLPAAGRPNVETLGLPLALVCLADAIMSVLAGQARALVSQVDKTAISNPKHSARGWVDAATVV